MLLSAARRAPPVPRAAAIYVNRYRGVTPARRRHAAAATARRRPDTPLTRCHCHVAAAENFDVATA